MGQQVMNQNVGELCMGMKSVNLRVIVLRVGELFCGSSHFSEITELCVVVHVKCINEVLNLVTLASAC